jgi:hypothetical protein
MSRKRQSDTECTEYSMDAQFKSIETLDDFMRKRMGLPVTDATEPDPACHNCLWFHKCRAEGKPRTDKLRVPKGRAEMFPGYGVQSKEGRSYGKRRHR